VIQASARKKAFFTVQDYFSIFSHFFSKKHSRFFSRVFGNFFSLFLCSLFVRFSQAAVFFSFLLFRSIRCFQTKIKTNASSSFFARTTTHSDECAKSRAVLYHRLIFTRSCYLCVCERERERAKESSVRLIKLF